MRVVVDTNVFVSGVFFRGPPGRIVEAWRDARLTFVVSRAILDEYSRVAAQLAADFPGVELKPILDVLIQRAEVCDAPRFPQPVCRDPDDDKFLEVAIAADARVLVSGDKDLLVLRGQVPIEIYTPAAFVRRYLT